MRALLTITAAAASSLAFIGCSNDRDMTMGSLLVDEPASAEQAVHGVCPNGATTFGIDVSKWQGNINWGAVAGAGVKYAFIRVSDGTGYHDEFYDANWAGAKNAGILRGTYQFFRSDDDPIAQADLLISRMGPLGPGDLPPVADVESTDGVSNATRAARLHQWLDRVEGALGVRPIIYTGGYFWQDNVGQDFSSYPLWHAGYTGGDCPSTVANQWPGWAFWQFTSSGSVAGIAGNVDENRYNGDLSQLQQWANNNRAPVGYLDDANCDGGAVGWAQDPDAPSDPIAVHVYIDGPAGSGAHGFPTTANIHRDDLCAAIGSCEHGFALRIPNAYRDGAAHTAFAYGIDSAGGNNPELADDQRTFTCAPPALPFRGVLRHVPNPDVMTAWSLSFDDVAAEGHDVMDALPRAGDWVGAPTLVRGDGDAAVYVVDADGSLRHVISADAMAAWHLSFDAVQVRPLAEIDATPKGPELPAAPFLLRLAGDPGVYVLDAAPATPPPPGEGEGDVAGEGEGDAAGEGEGDDAVGESEGDDAFEGEGEGDDVVVVPQAKASCAQAATPSTLASFGSLAALALIVRRRRRS